MADLVLPVTPGTLPAGACPSSYQEMLNLFSTFQSVTFPSSQGNLVVSATTPADTTATWLQLDSLGRPVRIYYFASGAWLSLHPCVPGFTMIWTQTLPTMNTFDGGDASALSAISGPMWEVVTAMGARFPLGAGTLPSTTVIAIGDTGGTEDTTLTVPNIPAHGHQLWVGSSDGAQSGIREALQTCDSPASGTSAAYKTNDGSHNNYVQNSGSGTAFSNMPPYFGVSFLRRTARLFYRV